MMKTLLIALPLFALGACEKAGDATLNNNTASDTDVIMETESVPSEATDTGNTQNRADEESAQ